jgi:hypothetical protein
VEANRFGTIMFVREMTTNRIADHLAKFGHIFSLREDGLAQGTRSVPAFGIFFHEKYNFAH